MAVVFCKDCKFCKRTIVDIILRIWKNAKCRHNKGIRQPPGYDLEGLVSGKKLKVRYDDCSYMRDEEARCGKAAQFYIPKDRIKQVEMKLDGGRIEE